MFPFGSISSTDTLYGDDVVWRKENISHGNCSQQELAIILSHYCRSLIFLVISVDLFDFTLQCEFEGTNMQQMRTWPLYMICAVYRHHDMKTGGVVTMECEGNVPFSRCIQNNVFRFG